MHQRKLHQMSRQLQLKHQKRQRRQVQLLVQCQAHVQVDRVLETIHLLRHRDHRAPATILFHPVVPAHVQVVE